MSLNSDTKGSAQDEYQAEKRLAAGERTVRGAVKPVEKSEPSEAAASEPDSAPGETRPEPGQPKG
ncbi:MAG: hypothetical protein WD273_02285 [Trueperaceae bacterium]